MLASGGESVSAREEGRTDSTTTASTPVVRVAGLIGVVSPFDGNQEDWIEYAERLEHYFTVNDITDIAKKRAIVLNGAGATTYRLIKTLALPETPKDLTFEEIDKRVTTHFNPKPSPIVKRFDFNTRIQSDSESVADFVASLRKITEHCEYGTFLNDMLRDRLVCVIYDKRVQRRFLQESKLTYKQALDLALAAEAAAKDAKRLQGQRDDRPSDESTVHQVHKPAFRGEPSRSRQCYRCGGRHQASQCKFKEYECHFCKKKGHLASVCRKKREWHRRVSHRKNKRTV